MVTKLDQGIAKFKSLTFSNTRAEESPVVLPTLQLSVSNDEDHEIDKKIEKNFKRDRNLT